MAVAIASLQQETNTFSPVGTRYRDFDPVFGAGALDRHAGKPTEMGGFIDVLRRSGKRPVPLCAAWAITANRLARKDFLRFVAEFSRRLAGCGRPEALLLAMHGAQAADGEDDVTGCVLQRARRILGKSVPIAVTLDLHANVTPRMVEHADVIVGYQTYPHVDLYETGQKAARLALRMAQGRLKPAMALRKLPLIVPAETMPTTSGPMRRLIDRATRLESTGQAESVSVFGVQPWLDVRDMGCSVVVVTSGDPDASERHASVLARRFWNARKEFDVRLTPVREAIRRALRVPGGPVVLAESSDSTGSGSPGDSTGVLRELVAANLPEPSTIFVVDPGAVAQAMRAGVGNSLALDVGGAFDRKNSRPVRLRARVRLLSDGRWQPTIRGYSAGTEVAMGRTAVLEAGSVRILVSERSAMTLDPELFRSHGIEPCRTKIVVVKSPAGFRAAYEPIAKAIFIVDTPGVSTANLQTLLFRRVPRPIYPLDPGTRLPEGV
jgi:microcystin degradation protein MlrC